MINPESTIQEFLMYWNQPENSPQCTEATIKKRASMIQKRIIPCLGPVQLKQYELRHVRCLEQSLQNDDMKGTMITFRAAMLYAEKHSLIPDSFSRKMHIPDHVVPVHIFTKPQIDAIFNAIRFHPMVNYYKLIYYTMMMSREAKAIQLEDIDLDSATLHVHQMIRGNSSARPDIHPLPPFRMRSIPLTKEAMAAIQDELNRRNRKKESIHWNSSDFLFVHENGSPYLNNQVGEVRLIVKAVTGIDDFSTASLRLTAFSVLMDSGISPVTIKDIAGVSSLAELKRMEKKIQI